MQLTTANSSRQQVSIHQSHRELFEIKRLFKVKDTSVNSVVLFKLIASDIPHGLVTWLASEYNKKSRSCGNKTCPSGAGVFYIIM